MWQGPESCGEVSWALRRRWVDVQCTFVIHHLPLMYCCTSVADGRYRVVVWCTNTESEYNQRLSSAADVQRNRVLQRALPHSLKSLWVPMSSLHWHAPGSLLLPLVHSSGNTSTDSLSHPILPMFWTIWVTSNHNDAHGAQNI